MANAYKHTVTEFHAILYFVKNCLNSGKICFIRFAEALLTEYIYYVRIMIKQTGSLQSFCVFVGILDALYKEAERSILRISCFEQISDESKLI